MRMLSIVVLLSAVALTAVWAQSAGKTPPKGPAKPTPAVTAAQHEFLRKKMRKHGDAMENLAFDVATLDYAAVKEHANAIADEPRLDRKAADAVGLSPTFFELQDQLRKRARELAELADKQESESLAVATSDVLNTCVSCHSIFRHPPDAGTPAPAK